MTMARRLSIASLARRAGAPVARSRLGFMRSILRFGLLLPRADPRRAFRPMLRAGSDSLHRPGRSRHGLGLGRRRHRLALALLTWRPPQRRPAHTPRPHPAPKQPAPPPTPTPTARLAPAPPAATRCHPG